MPKKNFKNFGEMQGYEYLKGVISSVDGDTDTCALSINGAEHKTVPIYYHCSEDAEEISNGAIEGSAAGFAEDDEVIVLKQREGLENKIFVVGHIDGARVCGSGLMVFPFSYRVGYAETYWKVVQVDVRGIVTEYPLENPDGVSGLITQPFNQFDQVYSLSAIFAYNNLTVTASSKSAEYVSLDRDMDYSGYDNRVTTIGEQRCASCSCTCAEGYPNYGKTATVTQCNTLRTTSGDYGPEATQENVYSPYSGGPIADSLEIDVGYAKRVTNMFLQEIYSFYVSWSCCICEPGGPPPPDPSWSTVENWDRSGGSYATVVSPPEANCDPYAGIIVGGKVQSSRYYGTAGISSSSTFSVDFYHMDGTVEPARTVTESGYPYMVDPRLGISAPFYYYGNAAAVIERLYGKNENSTTEYLYFAESLEVYHQRNRPLMDPAVPDVFRYDITKMTKVITTANILSWFGATADDLEDIVNDIGGYPLNCSTVYMLEES